MNESSINMPHAPGLIKSKDSPEQADLVMYSTSAVWFSALCDLWKPLNVSETLNRDHDSTYSQDFYGDSMK